MAVPTRAEVEALLADRIAADPAFREALLADPHGVLSDLVGMPIPDSVTVNLHEESLTHIHLTIPAAEIADDDLELVAGGWGSGCGYVGTGSCSGNTPQAP